MSVPEYKNLKIEERSDGIAIITLNRPERLNALSFDLIDELNAYLARLQVNLDVRVVILTGAGRGFSAGIDLNDLGQIYKENVPEQYHHHQYLLSRDTFKRVAIIQELLTYLILGFRRIPQPVIAAVNGPAFGAGFALALASDIRVAGESAVFCNAFIKIGISGGDCGSTYLLPRLVGLSRATEIIFTGRNVTATEADRIGLVSKTIPDAQLQETALAIAQDLLDKSPLGLRYTKEALNMNVDAQSLEAAIKFENRTQTLTTSTKDAAEGIAAQREKRKPRYGTW
ncbi:MAG: enoyl-CoA hydratase/isomerase [Promethearchaeota archaeon CR_4]|nr:MAG: enoyl-CoA hydratase/isomerase [Candidatus Lokiarchaeota archaeon CR_4]